MKSRNITQTEVDFSKVKTEEIETLKGILMVLCETLEKIVILEKEVSEKTKDEGIWEYYEKEYGEIVSRICTERLLQLGYADSISEPPMYFYIQGKHKADIEMAGEDKVVITFSYENGMHEKHRFTFIKTENDWKIDVFQYCFAHEERWYSYHI